MQNPKNDADRFSFILSELRSQTTAQAEIKKDVTFIKERLFIKRNGNPSLEAQTDSNTDDIKALQKSQSQFIRNYLAPIVVAIVVAIIIINLIPK